MDNQKCSKGMKINIIILTIVTLVSIYWFMPYKSVWLDDSVIYGKSFCDTYDGSCVSTSGHSTRTRLNNYQLKKYQGRYVIYDKYRRIYKGK